MGKERVVCMYSELSLSPKGDWAGPLVEMGMALETQSELSQKSNYCISTHICGVEKNGIDYFICEAETKRLLREQAREVR